MIIRRRRLEEGRKRKPLHQLSKKSSNLRSRHLSRPATGNLLVQRGTRVQSPKRRQRPCTPKPLRLKARKLLPLRRLHRARSLLHQRSSNPARPLPHGPGLLLAPVGFLKLSSRNRLRSPLKRFLRRIRPRMRYLLLPNPPFPSPVRPLNPLPPSKPLHRPLPHLARVRPQLRRRPSLPPPRHPAPPRLHSPAELPQNSLPHILVL